MNHLFVLQGERSPDHNVDQLGSGTANVNLEIDTVPEQVNNSSDGDDMVLKQPVSHNPTHDDTL